MTWGTFKEDENKALPSHREPDPRYEIRPGDILVSRANTEAYVGAPVLVGECRRRLLLSDKSLRLKPASNIDPRWLVYALASPTVRRQISAKSTGAQESMRNISQSALADVELLLPPAVEQKRIVEAVEDHLSRLDAAETAVVADQRRAVMLAKRIIISAVPLPAPEHWQVVTVAEGGAVDLGRQRHPDWHTGDSMRPYLRVANVFEDRIDVDDVMEMHFPDELFERFRLRIGDILLNEGQSPEYLGRPAMYRGLPRDVAFTNSLLRFRANDGVDPEWALLVFRRHMHARRFVEEVRITTNIAHLSAGRFKSVEFPIPPIHEQLQIVASTKELLSGVDRLAAALAKARQRAVHLRQALLEAALKGQLAKQNPSDECARELLEKIETEQRGTSLSRRGARRSPVLAPRKPSGQSAGFQEELPL